MKGNCYDINSTDQLHIYTNHIKKSIDCHFPKMLSIPYEMGTEAWNILKSHKFSLHKEQFSDELSAFIYAFSLFSHTSKSRIEN